MPQVTELLGSGALLLALSMPSGCSSPAGASSPQLAVATVGVSPESTDVIVGAQRTLTATPKDVTGAALAGRTVTWTTSDALVGSVTSDGLASGLAPGTVTISASSEGRTGTSRLRVLAASPVGTVTECASPRDGWIWCDDFEQDRLSSYFEYENPGGRFTRVAAVGHSASYGMRARWAVGAQSAGALHLAFGATPQAYMKPVDAGTAKYREIYWRFRVRRQPGWSGGGGDKVTRAHIFAAPTSFAQALAAHVWSGTGEDADYLMIDPASGTDASGTLVATTYNDPNFRWLGSVRGNTPIFGAGASNVWQCIESHVRLNDPGVSNGVFEVWLDGAMEIQKAGMNWIGSYGAYGINAINLENYWNSGSPAVQDRYFDDFVVSTQRIGC